MKATNVRQRSKPIRVRLRMRDPDMSKTLTFLLLGFTLLGAMPGSAQSERISGLWEGIFHRDRAINRWR